MKYLFLHIILLFNLIGISQNSIIIDSLKSELLVTEGEDYAKNLIDISMYFQFEEGGFDSMFVYLEQSLKLSKEIGYLDGEVRSHYFLGTANWYRDSNFKQALYHFKETRKLMQGSKNLNQVQAVENAIGVIYGFLGEYEEAIHHYNEANKIAEDKGDYGVLSMTANNIAIIYSKIPDIDRAIEYRYQSLKYLERDKSNDKPINYINTTLSLVTLLLEKDSLQKAERIIYDLKPNVEELNQTRETARLRYAEMCLSFKRGDVKGIIPSATQLLNRYKGVIGVDEAMYSKSLSLLCFAHIEGGNFIKAKQLLQELTPIKSTRDRFLRASILKDIAQLANDIGLYDEAIVHQLEYSALHDSLMNESTHRKILELQAEYDLAKKERELEKQERDNIILKQRNTLYLSLLAILALVGLYIYQSLKRRSQKDQEKINQIEQKMLSLQMNPHFVFNAISSIQNYLFDENDSKAAITHLATFANLMRQILENSREKFITLDSEVAFLENYLKMQKLRFDDKFDYTISIEEDIDPHDLKIPPLITQPFVENAIEHGKVYLLEDGLININIRKEEGQLVLYILDNGIGLESDNDEPKSSSIVKKKSLSIAITKERLSLLSKLFKATYQLSIEQQKSRGTMVQINLPILPFNT